MPDLDAYKFTCPGCNSTTSEENCRARETALFTRMQPRGCGSRTSARTVDT